MTSFDNLVNIVINQQSKISDNKSLLVAVTGIDGSGKGYVTEKLVTALNKQTINTVSINLDAWHTLPSHRFDSERSPSHFYANAFDFDSLFEQLIFPLQKQREINLTTVLSGILGIPKIYNYQFTNVDVIILEGILLLKRSFQHFYDLKIWIECSWETALARAIKRNQEGISLEELIQDYQNLYFPVQRLHLQLDDPQANADYIYVN